ncbi:MAG: alternative ribosome rescue factor ArfA [Alphaproteobacteria bacterium]
MSSSRKYKRRTNPIAKALRTPTFQQRKIRPKKGRGSYSRANRTSGSGRRGGH